MTQETGPRTETPRPQEKALTIVRAITLADEVIKVLGQLGGNTDQIADVEKRLLKVKSGILIYEITVEERSEVSSLLDFAEIICKSPDGAKNAKHQMKKNGYTSLEIKSFIKTVESTRKYQEAAMPQRRRDTGLYPY